MCRATFFSGNPDVEAYKQKAAQVCKIEFHNILDQTEIDKIASQAKSVDDFDEVIKDISFS